RSDPPGQYNPFQMSSGQKRAQAAAATGCLSTALAAGGATKSRSFAVAHAAAAATTASNKGFPPPTWSNCASVSSTSPAGWPGNMARSASLKLFRYSGSFQARITSSEDIILSLYCRRLQLGPPVGSCPKDISGQDFRTLSLSKQSVSFPTSVENY